MSNQVFEGLKVADFSWAIVGPVIARYLGDHGATVVRVESATRPDIVRASPPFKDKVAGINRSAYFTNYNSSKYGLSLNMDLPQAREVARRLAVWSDVVIESMAPGVIKGWGLGYDDLKALKPDLIMMSTSNLGQTGPLASMVGFGTQLVSQAGFTHLTGWPDREPAQPYAAYTDMLAPGFGTAALIGALEYRRRTGKGQYLDLSQLEAGLHFLASLFLDHQMNGVEANRNGNRSPYAAPHGAYRCRGEGPSGGSPSPFRESSTSREQTGQDRWCAIAVDSETAWQTFKHHISTDCLWVNDPRFATLQGRKANEDEMDKLVEAWTIEQTAEDVMARLQAAGVAAGVVKNARDILEDPQLRHRQHYQVLNHPEIGPHTYDYPPFHLSRTPAELRNAPCLGEHNEFVIKELLGMTDEEYVELLVSGALE